MESIYLGWNDYDPASKIGGYRESGYGCFILLEENKIYLKRGKIQDQMMGKSITEILLLPIGYLLVI